VRYSKVYAQVYVYSAMFMYVCMCMCVCVRARVHAPLNEFKDAIMHPFYSSPQVQQLEGPMTTVIIATQLHRKSLAQARYVYELPSRSRYSFSMSLQRETSVSKGVTLCCRSNKTTYSTTHFSIFCLISAGSIAPRLLV
jgi:hypothetical protein